MKPTRAPCLLAILAFWALGMSAAEDIAALKRQAEAGDADAQFGLGWSYAKAEGVPKDMVEAAKWWRKAAEQGHVIAQHNLAVHYRDGEGVPKDMVEAAKWWRKAAEQGHAAAQVCLGFSYRNGEGVPKDMSEAVKWFRKAAEQGHVDGQVCLGLSYDDGEGVPKDMVEAAKWFRKAAEQGDKGGQFCLGNCYSKGEGVPKDMVEAAKWFRKAAEQGHVGGQGSLGFAYAFGKGVPKDEIEALAWLNLAAASSDEAYTKTRNIMEQQLGREATLLAQQRSKELLKEIEARKNRAATSSGETGPSEAAGAEPKATGSGVFVTADGLIMSAAHVLKGASNVRVVTSQGIKAARVFQVDEANDVAILHCVGTFTAAPLVPSEGVRLGQSVFTLGFPNVGMQGFEPKLTKGEISSMGGIRDDPRQWQISVPVQPGNSGGALFDENGNVVGVVVARLSDRAAIKSSGAIPQNINYAVKSAYVLPLLGPFNKRLPSPHKPASLAKFEDVVQKARESVVLVVVY